MPELRRYLVTQVRQIEVTANDEVLAAQFASQVLDSKTTMANASTSVVKPTRVTDLRVEVQRP